MVSTCKRVDALAGDVAEQHATVRLIPHRRLGHAAARVPDQFEFAHASLPFRHAATPDTGPGGANVPLRARTGETMQAQRIWRPGRAGRAAAGGARTGRRRMVRMTIRICCGCGRTPASSRITRPHCDRAVLVAAVILHDCVAVEKNSPDRARASRLAADSGAGDRRRARLAIRPHRPPGARDRGPQLQRRHSRRRRSRRKSCRMPTGWTRSGQSAWRAASTSPGGWGPALYSPDDPAAARAAAERSGFRARPFRCEAVQTGGQLPDRDRQASGGGADPDDATLL